VSGPELQPGQALLNGSSPEVVRKWFLLVTSVGGLCGDDWCRSVVVSGVATGVDQHSEVTKCPEDSTQAPLRLSGFIRDVDDLPVPLNNACVSVCTAHLDSHTCCVCYDSRPDPPHITSSPSRWHRQAGEEQEGNDLMAFLLEAWHELQVA